MPAEDVGPGRGERRRLPWLFLVLVIAAITSSSLSVISLYHVLALQAEVEGLRAEVVRRREEQSGTHQQEEEESKERIEYLQQTEMDDTVTDHTVLSKRSLGHTPSKAESQPCLQMMANNRKKTFQKEFALEICTAIPWQVGLKRGTALEEEQGTILIKEEGFFFIYSQLSFSQVYYTDSTFAMGHIVIRIKKNVVGDESQHVVLFRCIQSMNRVNHFNTCYTGGLVKLDSGDRLELLIPRTHANISLDGDSTFLGAIKLA
ncbi:tumor necrosis factor ligand superfamily member 13B isoform X1 [Cyprinus carpio]|uniref:Tumor necrosis factor ligand superfamily member 13B isoform X1 n=1 Tax=Cyprinus carpio TaxID=7962 RepID=A0A9Q9V9Q7_CYPCA|nr:tumor necrosis factor ligand superfamily member 13B isoform X1 [Cyprinus carpio]